MKYYFNVSIRKNGELVDDFNVWYRASSKQEAESILRGEYPNASDYILTGTAND